MHIVLIADAFPPMRSSAAIQLRDLCISFVEHGHYPTILIPASDIKNNWQIEMWNGIRIVRLKSPKTKDINYIRRTLGEFLMPFSMLRNLRMSSLADESWDGLIWYSPTIFLGPIAKALKRDSLCRSYLIVRDIFPEWAVDMELMGRGLPYLFFKAIANFQYSVADVIGVQTKGNIKYIPNSALLPSCRIEVLNNWLKESPNTGCGISIQDTVLSGRKIFIYAGNMGVAQRVEIFIDLADKLKYRNDIGFLFVGRGSNVEQLKKQTVVRDLDNVLFFNEINPDELPGLFAQCHFGLVALDPRHKTHNIPGKFLTYIQNGLPVLASINPDNNLIDIITKNDVGCVDTSISTDVLAEKALFLIDKMTNDNKVEERCRLLAKRLFSPSVAVKQIISALSE